MSAPKLFPCLLVLGFAFVIGAFVTSNIVTQRSARLATADVARAQDEFEPLARHARDLGAAAAAFDRAVLAFLRSGSGENKTAAVEMGTRLSEAITESSEFARLRNDPRIEEMAARLAHQQAQGFKLVELQESRNATLRNLEKALGELDRRMASAGGRGLRFGDNLLARPAIVGSYASKFSVAVLISEFNEDKIH